MEQTQNNPATNALGAGLTEKALGQAIVRSGYPLQSIVGNSLRSKLVVQDEWPYVDRVTREIRTLDVFAQNWLFDWPSRPQPRVRPTLNLIIECKQSDLPFLFFLSPERPLLDHFPMIAGLPRDDIQVDTDDSASTWKVTVPSLFGLAEHAFVTEPPYCYTLSKCVRKGSDLILSGSDSYNSLVLPLANALLHFQTSQQPVGSAAYFDAHLALGIAVLNAPMIGCKVLQNGVRQIAVPWIRVVRHEYFEDLDYWSRSQHLVLDVVHKDFFEAYIADHVMPFAQQFATLALRHQHVLASGRGFVSGLSADFQTSLELRLRPKHRKDTAGRVRIVLTNLLRLAIGRKPRD